MEIVSRSSSAGQFDWADAPAETPEIPTLDIDAASLDYEAERASDRIAAEAWFAWNAGREHERRQRGGLTDFDVLPAGSWD